MTKTVKLVTAMMVAFGASAFVPAAQAYTTDSFLFSTNLKNSGASTEETALENYLGGADVVFDSKLDKPKAVYDSVNGNWYIDIDPNQPGYFLLKFGTGGTGVSDDTFYFQNIAELTKLVFTSDQVGFLLGGGDCKNCNIGRLSHYTAYNGDPGKVPEPGTAALVGVGLLGLLAARRRKDS